MQDLWRSGSSGNDDSEAVPDEIFGGGRAWRTRDTRIHVIDDNQSVVDMVSTLLRGEGYRVLGALTGDAGLKLAILSRPELVLLDIGLPEMNGLELLTRIRSMNPNARVIMVTGNTDPDLAREAFRLGALAYVDKPFDLGTLKRAVAMALNGGVVG